MSFGADNTFKVFRWAWIRNSEFFQSFIGIFDLFQQARHFLLSIFVQPEWLISRNIFVFPNTFLCWIRQRWLIHLWSAMIISTFSVPFRFTSVFEASFTFMFCSKSYIQRFLVIFVYVLNPSKTASALSGPKKWRQRFQNLKLAFLCQKVSPQTSSDQNTIFSESEWKNASFDIRLMMYNDLQICFWISKNVVVKMALFSNLWQIFFKFS